MEAHPPYRLPVGLHPSGLPLLAGDTGASRAPERAQEQDSPCGLADTRQTAASELATSGTPRAGLRSCRSL